MKHCLWICFLLAMLVSGCTQEEMLRNGTSVSGEGRTFTTSFENDESRTYLEDGLYSRWTEGDRISLFDASTLNSQYLFAGDTGDSGGTFFRLSKPEGTGNSLAANYAVYPYDKDMTISADGVITLNLPSNQHYAENSYGLGDNTMVAVTENADDTFLQFKNVGGAFKLQLYGDDVTVKSIILNGNNDEKIAGKAMITAAYGEAPVVTMADDATTSITLDCGEKGVKIGASAEEATAFWVVVPPTAFEKGITITVTDINGNKYTKSTEKNIEIKRNVVTNMAAFKVEQLVYGCGYLTSDCLEGWDAGYFDSNNCFIVCRKESDGGYLAYLGQKDKLDDGITLKFDANLDIQIVFSNKGILNVWEDESIQQKYVTLALEDGIHVTTFNQLVRSRTVSTISVSEALGIICKWVNNALTGKDIATLFENGNDYLPTFIVNIVLGQSFTMMLGPVGGLSISIGLGYLEQKYEDDYYRLLIDYMGRPMVYISDIIDKDAPNYKIEVQIDGLDDMGKPLGTSIHTGIAVREGESNVTYENCDYKLQDHEVQLNETHFDANLKVEPKRYYYLRPYTIVMVNRVGYRFPFMRNKYLWGGAQEPLISYGDVDKIFFDINASAITGDWVSLTDKTAIVKCSYKNVDGMEGIECGVCVVNLDTGETMELPTNSSDGEREIHISGLTPVTTYTYNAYIKKNNTIIKEGKKKYFATTLPDISGTWHCQEGKDSYTLTLQQDGSATCSLYDHIEIGSWSFGEDGTVSVGIMTIGTNTFNSGVRWEGVVDNLKNPKKVTGSTYNWNYNHIGYFQGDSRKMIMTR